MKPKVNIEVDEFNGFYRHKDLSLPEVKYLFSRKYKLIEKKSIVSSKKEKFLIKPRFNESINHAFVIYDIKEFLEKKSLDVKTYMTKKPDITFEMNGKKYAIEVETGSILSVKKQLMEKIKLMKEHYDEWFFVVTDKNHAKKYKKYGKTIDIRYLASHLNKIARNSTTKKERTNTVCRRENKAKKKK